MPHEHFVPVLRKPADATWQRTVQFSSYVHSKKITGLKSKESEGLWKNIRVANRGSEIPGKANDCLVPYVLFTLHLKTPQFWAGSTYSLLHVTATVMARLRLISGSWRGKRDKPLCSWVVRKTCCQAQGMGWPLRHLFAKCRELENGPQLYKKLMRVLGRAEF